MQIYYYFCNKRGSPLEGNHSNITISKDTTDRYFVSFCSEVEIKSLPKVDKTVGIDLSLTDFVITKNQAVKRID